MNFEPQIPEWGLDDFKNHQDKLFEYHEWLKNTAIKTGLISKKTDQFIWDEFIIHSLYFAKLIMIKELGNLKNFYKKVLFRQKMVLYLQPLN